METDHDRVGGEFLPDVFNEVNEVLGVAVGHVNADVLQLGHCRQHGWNLLKVGFARACADSYALESTQ